MTFPTSELDPKEKNISELLAKCETSINSKNFEDAINGCRAVLNISPENQRAKELMDEAQSKLEADLFTKENLRKAHEYFKLRDYQKCINECQKIQLLDPENQSVSELLSKSQEKQEAEPFVQNFINSGRSLFESGLYNEAISQWEKVRSIDPDYPDLDRLINNARHMMGPEPLSEQPLFDLESTPGMEPQPASDGFGFVSDNDRIKQLLDEGDRLYNNEQYQGAIEVWSEIFMLDVNHPEALERIEKARNAASEQRLKLKDMLREAQSAYERGEIDQAHELFAKVRSVDPENTEAAKYLSLIERTDEEPSVEALIASGEDAEKRGQYREAAQYFSQALAVDSENAALADKIKSLNLLAKRHEQSRNLLGNARAFVAEGKFESARHALSKILENDPSNTEALELMRTVKESAPTAASMPAAVRPAMRRGLPVSPAIIIAVFVLIAAGGGYFFFFSGNDDSSTPPRHSASNPGTNSLPVKRPGNPVASRPGTTVSQKGPEEPSDKVSRMLREAQFYLREKQYDTAITKAQEVLTLDPSNKDAIGVRLDALKAKQDIEANEKKLLEEANTYFEYSEFAGAVKLYEKYLSKHSEDRAKIQPLVIKCYYNLGVLAIREWRCDIAGDYFRQVLFIDETDQLSKDALGIARRCQKSGASDIEVRKSVSLMEMRH
jgi:tetratricopeptide (TPR) repeat protein